MKFFQEQKEPILTVIVNNFTTLEDALKCIKDGVREGAEAFCIEIQRLPFSLRTGNNMSQLFQAMEGRPAYVACYRRENTFLGESDDEIAEELLMALRSGAALIDIRMDMFDPQKNEITDDEYAIRKQKELIKTIHDLGGEVVMSAHTNSFMSPRKVLETMEEQVRRGADLCKVVNISNNTLTTKIAFKTSKLLQNQLGHKHLYLIAGKACQAHRESAPLLGDSLFLCNTDENEGRLQPTITVAKKVKSQLGVRG